MKDPRQLLLKNVFSNWASFAVGIAVTFLLSPFMVHSLGKEEYGIWALVFSIINYTNLLDAGMKQSLARYIPKYYANKDYVKINEIINSSNLIYSITGTLVIVVTVVIALFFTGAFKVGAESLGTMQILLIIVGLDQAIAFYFMSGTAIGPFHRYDVSNLIGVVSSLIHAVLIYIVLSQGYGLIALASVTVANNVVRHIVRRWYQQHLVPELRFRLRYVNKAAIKELLGYGLDSFFIVASWMVVFHTGNIVIGLFISTTAVTYYNIAGNLINYLRVLINAIGVPLVPAISHIDAMGNRDQINSLYTKISRYLFYITTTICTVTLMFGAKFIYTWMGPEFIETVKVLHILIIPISIYLPQIIANSILLGIGEHRALFYILLVESAANLGLSLALVKPLGIYGVALSTAFVQIFIYTYIFPYFFNKLINGNLKLFYANSLKMIAVGTIFTVPVGMILRQVNTSLGWTSLIIDALAITPMIILGFWFGVLSRDDRSRLLEKYTKKKLATESV